MTVKYNGTVVPLLKSWSFSMSKFDIRQECVVKERCVQCLSQDLETGCLKLAVVKFLGVQIFKGDANILIFQP